MVVEADIEREQDLVGAEVHRERTAEPIDRGVLLDDGTNIPNDLLVGVSPISRCRLSFASTTAIAARTRPIRTGSNAVRIRAARKLSEQDAEKARPTPVRSPCQEQDAERPGILLVLTASIGLSRLAAGSWR